MSTFDAAAPELHPVYAAFLERIEAFLEDSGMTQTAFGRAAAHDPNFVSDVRKGRKPNLDLIEAVETFMKRERKGERL